jgi:hypothetical protein
MFSPPSVSSFGANLLFEGTHIKLWMHDSSFIIHQSSFIMWCYSSSSPSPSPSFMFIHQNIDREIPLYWQGLHYEQNQSASFVLAPLGPLQYEWLPSRLFTNNNPTSETCISKKFCTRTCFPGDYVIFRYLLRRELEHIMQVDKNSALNSPMPCSHFFSSQWFSLVSLRW